MRLIRLHRAVRKRIGYTRVFARKQPDAEGVICRKLFATKGKKSGRMSHRALCQAQTAYGVRISSTKIAKSLSLNSDVYIARHPSFYKQKLYL